MIVPPVTYAAQVQEIGHINQLDTSNGFLKIKLYSLFFGIRAND